MGGWLGRCRCHWMCHACGSACCCHVLPLWLYGKAVSALQKRHVRVCVLFLQPTCDPLPLLVELAAPPPPPPHTPSLMSAAAMQMTTRG